MTVYVSVNASVVPGLTAILTPQDTPTTLRCELDPLGHRDHNLTVLMGEPKRTRLIHVPGDDDLNKPAPVKLNRVYGVSSATTNAPIRIRGGKFGI